jgi:hypothetical protein
LESYKAFARNLPSQFDDHTWLAESDEGTPVGCAACWSNSAGDARVMECYVYVRAPWRSKGIGRNLALAVLEEAERDGRPKMVWTTYDSIPAGEAFSRRAGGTVARVNRTSELELSSVDWKMARGWIAEGLLRAPGIACSSVTARSRPRWSATQSCSSASCKRRHGTSSTSAMSSWKPST